MMVYGVDSEFPSTACVRIDVGSGYGFAIGWGTAYPVLNSSVL